MMKKMVAGLSALMLLAGCASDVPEVIEGEGEGEGWSASSLPSWSAEEGPVTWTCEGEPAQGVVYSISLPTDMSHEGVVMMEELREKLDGDEVQYIVVEIDATQAEGARAGVSSLEWATAEQTSASAEPAVWLIDEWQESLSMDDNGDIDLYNEAVDVNNTLIDTAPNRGANGYVLLAADAPIDSMVAPSVLPDIFGGIECTR